MKSARDVTLYWKPGTSQVQVSSKLADFSGWKASNMDTASYREIPDEDLQKLVLAQALTLIIRDRCDPIAVHLALMRITEYRAHWEGTDMEDVGNLGF